MYNHYVKTTFWSCIWNTLISHINYCNSLQPIEDFLYVHVYTRISQSIFFSEYSHLNRNAPTPAFLSYRKPVLVFGLEGTFCTFVSIICVALRDQHDWWLKVCNVLQTYVFCFWRQAPSIQPPDNILHGLKGITALRGRNRYNHKVILMTIIQIIMIYLV